ncbi:GNAT family N-acetyltransferase [Candidatus Viridilinea mediisalina]|nr:GNAT family N-acetyltransferase [Candidatus Viridilinea mediisalina]
MKLHLRTCTQADLPRITTWLHADHVRRAWGDPDGNLELLRAEAPHGSWRAIIVADGVDVGLILWQHPTRHELDVAGLHDIPASVIDIDIMIGEQAATGKGIGSAAIKLVAEAALHNPEVPFVMACAHVENHASQRAFEQAGFRRDRIFDDVPHGHYVLMVRHR